MTMDAGGSEESKDVDDGEFLRIDSAKCIQACESLSGEKVLLRHKVASQDMSVWVGPGMRNLMDPVDGERCLFNQAVKIHIGEVCSSLCGPNLFVICAWM